ncbi:AAA family ATPase [Nocardia sp. NPDC003482]
MTSSETSEVQRPVSIALVGSHSTGKTTFINTLAEQLRGRQIDVAIVNDLGRQAQDAGLPILYNHTWASTLWVITRGISLELEAWTKADVVLIDRGIPDALGYYEAALAYRELRPDQRRLEYLDQLVSDHVQHYDLILRTVLDPTVPLGETKPRDTDLRFRLLCDKYVHRVLHRLNIPHEQLLFNSHSQAIVETMGRIEGCLVEPHESSPGGHQ